MAHRSVWTGEKLQGMADSAALFLVWEETWLPGDLNVLGHIIEKPEKSSFTALGIWMHDLTSSPQTPMRGGLASASRRLCMPGALE